MSHTNRKPMKYLHKMTVGGAFLAVSPQKKQERIITPVFLT